MRAYKLSVELATRVNCFVKHISVRVSNSLDRRASDSLMVLHNSHSVKKFVLFGRNLCHFICGDVWLEDALCKHFVRCMQVRRCQPILAFAQGTRGKVTRPVVILAVCEWHHIIVPDWPGKIQVFNGVNVF